jgi:hypothetical protein
VLQVLVSYLHFHVVRMPILHVNVYAACPRVHASCPCFTSLLRVHAVCPCRMSIRLAMLHVPVACLCNMIMLMFMLHVHTACPYCISRLHVQGACQCYMYILHVHAVSPCLCSCQYRMSMLHFHAVYVSPTQPQLEKLVLYILARDLVAIGLQKPYASWNQAQILYCNMMFIDLLS